MVIVKFVATLQGAVNYTVDNNDPIQAVTAQDLADNLGTNGGFVVVRVGPDAGVANITYLAMKDSCKVVIQALRELQAKLTEKVAMWAHKTSNISTSTWKTCTITDRYRLLKQFVSYGSRNVATMLATARAYAPSDVSRNAFGSHHDLLGARALQITVAGHYCASYHPRAALDHVCPGGVGCLPDGTLAHNGTATIDLDGIACPMSSSTVVYSAVVLILLGVWFITFLRWVRRTNGPWYLDAMTTTKIIQLESYKRIQDKRDKEETFQAMLKNPIVSCQMPQRLHDHLNAASDFFYTEVAQLRSKAKRVPSYWFYKEITGDACGPFVDNTMNAMYHELNFLMHPDTLVREGWWPPDTFYTVQEVFPDTPSTNYFVSDPKVPDAVLAYAASDAAAGLLSTRSSALPTARRAKGKNSRATAQSGKPRQTSIDDGADPVPVSSSSQPPTLRGSLTAPDDGERKKKSTTSALDVELRNTRSKKKSTKSAAGAELLNTRPRAKSTKSASGAEERYARSRLHLTKSARALDLRNAGSRKDSRVSTPDAEMRNTGSQLKSTRSVKRPRRTQLDQSQTRYKAVASSERFGNTEQRTKQGDDPQASPALESARPAKSRARGGREAE